MRQIVAPGPRQIADMVARPRQIAAIGGQRVGRRTALGGKHREKGVDRRPGADWGADRGQARATASAAIIRASGSSPTRRSAETM